MKQPSPNVLSCDGLKPFVNIDSKLSREVPWNRSLNFPFAFSSSCSNCSWRSVFTGLTTTNCCTFSANPGIRRLSVARANVLPYVLHIQERTSSPFVCGFCKALVTCSGVLNFGNCFKISRRPGPLLGPAKVQCQSPGRTGIQVYRS